MNLNKEISLSKYNVTPRIVRAGESTEISISALGKGIRHDPIGVRLFGAGAGFYDTDEYTVTFIPMEMYDGTYVECDNVEFDSVKVYPKDGVITVKYTFYEEQEWILSVISCDNAEKKRKPLEFHIYSLNEDLYSLNPFRGDLHMHSVGSDGGEDPVVLAANYRKEGFDFISLTDHRTRVPSEELVSAYEGVKCELKMFHGEEVHLRGNIHVVNFGSKYSVNELYKNDAENIHASLVEEASRTGTPKYVNALEYCYRRWIYTQIKKAGGMTIIPHPFWVHSPGVYNMNVKMLEYVFKTGIFDAFELTGGQSVHENNIQTSFWQQLRSEGVNIPIVGSSDSHGTDPANYFGMSKTVLFAPDCEFDSIVSAIKGGYSVAIEEEYGEQPRVYGSFRLVKYVRFLLKYYFPGHDELCVEEGILMREYALGDSEAGERLNSLFGRVARYREHLLRGKS